MADPEKVVELMDAGEGDVEELEEEDEVSIVKSGMNDAEITDTIEELPLEVKRRVKALKKIQVEITKIEARFYEEMHTLECKYLPLYVPHFEKRRLVVLGEHEPDDDECAFVEDSDTEEISDSLNKIKIGEGDTSVAEKEKAKEKVSGIPDFWLTIFRNVDMLHEITEDHDEPILKHLQDIKVEMTNKPMGFKLMFYFSPNDYFGNNVLTKVYEMKCDVDQEDPFSFEGPEIIKCSGCTIDWVKGKNVTVKTIRKKQKHKQRGSIRTVCKTVEVNSFFNFFNPPQVPEDPDTEMDEEIQMRLTNDFEVGQYIRERIVPRAVLYYTGEALEDEYDDEEEEEEDDDDDDENDEEDDEEEEAKVPAIGGRNRGQKERFSRT